MPAWLHKQLAASAAKHHLTGERKDAYVYGTMNKIKAANHGKYPSAPKKKKKKKSGAQNYQAKHILGKSSGY
jgi:hypothetical protein